MPVYEYECQACGHEFEREQRITDDPVKTCPACKKRKVRRLISQTSFVLKGGGWYSDLYSSGKPKSEAKDDAKSDKAGDAKSDKSDSKSETKTSDKKDKGKDKKKGGGGKAAA